MYVFLQPLTVDPLLKIVLVQTHSELSETDNLRDESELIARKVCTEQNLSLKLNILLCMDYCQPLIPNVKNPNPDDWI